VLVEIAGRLTTRQRVLLVALLSTAAIVYALPVGQISVSSAEVLGLTFIPAGVQ